MKPLQRVNSIVAMSSACVLASVLAAAASIASPLASANPAGPAAPPSAASTPASSSPLSASPPAAPAPSTSPAASTTTSRTVHPTSHAAFASEVDLTAFGTVAVHTQGRVKSLESYARSAMQFISGSRSINEQSPVFTYFDLMLRPGDYADRDIVFFKNKLMRADVARALIAANAPGFDAERHDRFMKSGLLSARLITQPAVIELMQRLAGDVLRSARFVDAVRNALGVMNPEALRANLQFIPPPPPGSQEDPWLTIDELAAGDPRGSAIDASLRERITGQWQALQAAWREQNAAGVNDAAAQLATLLPQVNPQLYPETDRLAWESWYFRSYNMTWVWIPFALAMVPLLLGIVFRWPGAHWLGLLLFLIAFSLQTFAVMLRWYVSQRWPNSNMFEAITTAAWMGSCLALLMELFILRRSPMRGLLALGASVASMTAMMAVKMFPLELNADIRNMMPVLNDLWLYIHTNVIIFSYCLIFIAAVTAAIYLLWRGVLALQGRSGTAEYARVGGAGSLILTRPDGSSVIDEKKSTFGQVLDGTTMIVMEMSFVLLWAGIVMGAIWADHSWGRPWGWDPKEVFALNTFLVFLVLVHGRLKVKDKGLWTAALALVGAAVMLFNWIIINFAISGLHSYA